MLSKVLRFCPIRLQNVNELTRSVNLIHFVDVVILQARGLNLEKNGNTEIYLVIATCKQTRSVNKAVVGCVTIFVNAWMELDTLC